MKRYLLLLATLLLLVLQGCSKPPYTNINNDEFAQLKAEGVQVFDIRRPEEWRQTGVVDGSKTLTAFDKSGRFNPGFMSTFASEINPDQPVILICRTGNRTSALAQFLAEKQGYMKVYNVRSGITGWIREGRPVTKS